MSAITGTFAEQIYVNTADFGAKASWNSDLSILVAGPTEQPMIPAGFFFNKQGHHRTLRVELHGILGTLGAGVTYTFKVSLSTTQGIANIGTALATSAAIPAASTIASKAWWGFLDIQCNTAGSGAGGTTLSSVGGLYSPAGFASPFMAAWPDATTTFTATIDNSLTYFMNVSVAPSASDAANAITLKKLWVFGWN